MSDDVHREAGNVRDRLAAAVGAIRARRGARRQAITELFRAFTVRTTVHMTLAVITGVAPALFAALVGRVVDQIAPALSDGLDSAAGRALLVTLAAIAALLFTQELIGAGHELLVTSLYRRYDAHLLGRVLRSTTAGTGLDMFQDPDLAARRDRAVRIADYGPGELVSGLGRQWKARAQGVASVVLVASVAPVAALVLLPLWLGAAVALQTSYYRADPFWTDPMRRSAYLKDIGLRSAWAKELRIFGLGEWLVGRFTGEWTRVMGELWRARRTDYRVLTVVAVVLVTANALVLAWSLGHAVDGAFTVGQLTILVQGLLGLAALASMDGDVWIENGAVPVPDVLDFEKSVRRVETSSTATFPAPRVDHEIRFEDVRFAYPGREPVFDGLDLTVRAGTSLAVVGLNGAGKTTLVKLLAGLDRPQHGRILVDGVDLAEVSMDAWRERLAVLFADFVRYEFPARDNVGFGAVRNLHEADAQLGVRAAAERAGIDAVLANLPAGYATTLSRRYAGGVDLSGGQWQQVALARAMLAVDAGARVLVLDEPTAHLDVRAEAEIYDRFLDMTNGLSITSDPRRLRRRPAPTTTVVISHRFSTVRRADRIVLLDGGQITEDGSHEELLAAEGRYARLFRLQATRYGDVERHDTGWSREVGDE